MWDWPTWILWPHEEAGLLVRVKADHVQGALVVAVSDAESTHTSVPHPPLPPKKRSEVKKRQEKTLIEAAASVTGATPPPPPQEAERSQKKTRKNIDRSSSKRYSCHPARLLCDLTNSLARFHAGVSQ